MTTALLFLGGDKEPTARRAAGERLAGADARILELLGEVQALHRAICGDALALGFEPEAAVGLFFARNPYVANSGFHRFPLCGRRHDEGKN